MLTLIGGLRFKPAVVALVVLATTSLRFPVATAQTPCVQPNVPNGCPISLGGTVSASLAQPGDQHKWVLTLSGQASIRVTLGGLTAPYALHVLRGITILQESTTPSTADKVIVLPDLPAQTYLIYVDSPSGQVGSGSYQLSAQQDTAAAPPAAPAPAPAPSSPTTSGGCGSGSSGGSGSSSGPDYDIPNGHFYTQANGDAGPQFGYRITDEAGIGFWSAFQSLCGVSALGYPASRRFQLDGFVVQATQKVIMQWRPESGQVYFVNVFDKLHDMAKDGALQNTYQIPPQLDPSFDAGKAPDQIQAGRLGLLNADPAIAASFNSGPNPVLYNGLPTSQLTNEGPFNVIRAQRVAIQHWHSAGPGGIAAGTVSVVNGGDVAKALGLVPHDAGITETASGVPASQP